MKTLIIALRPYGAKGMDAWLDHGAGMTYTAAVRAGCNISFLDMSCIASETEMAQYMNQYDLIAFGIKSSYYSIGMDILRIAKSFGKKVLIGGYHVTAAPEQLTENPDIDWIFHGESEITFPTFLKSPNDFPREIWGEKPNNLDELPFMRRDIFPSPIEDCNGWWHGGRKKMITVMAARGCPYKCAFCQPLENNHFGKKLRRRSVESIIYELQILKEIYNPECVMIHDDTFFVQTSWLEEFVEEYPKIGLPFWAAGRADDICNHQDIFRKLVKVGWELVSVGFESGSQRILDIMKKGTTLQQNLEAARIIKDAGAKIYGNYMVGLPWEEEEDILATKYMVDQIDAEMPSWAYFTPYPGCDLGDKCINLGWSLLDRNNYNRCPSGRKVKNVDYEYIEKVMVG